MPQSSPPPPFSYPDGPNSPRGWQSALAVAAQLPTLRRWRKRYGDAFTIDLIGLGRAVVVADPDLIKQTLTARPDVLHSGDRSPLRPILGSSSLLTIDGDHHLRQRRLLLPPFHGQRMQGYERIIEEEARREIDRWPDGEELATLEPMMRITLNAILRAVFGAHGQQLRELQELLPPLVTLGSRMALLRFAQRDLGPWSPWGRFLRMRRAFDVHVDRLVAAARADPQLEQRSDVLSLLVQARHEDGSPMSRDQIADQLLTILAAGHETTASTLAWSVERLRRHPDLLRRLADEVEAGGSTLREATIREIQRIRPAIPMFGRYVVAPFQLGEWRLEPGSMIVLSAVLVHEDARIYEDPLRFRPERFLGTKPDTYRWIPFGGGVRRCIGASFAHMEMDIVLRTVIERLDLVPTAARDERWSYRGVAFVPARGGRAVVRRRPRPLTATSVTAPTPTPVAAG